MKVVAFQKLYKWTHIFVYLQQRLATTIYTLGRYMKMTIVEMRVHMDCPGCVSKIEKALKKLDGVDGVDIDMFMQKVTVTGWADQKKVLKTARKSGRKAELWPFPYNPEYHNFTHYYAYNQHHHHQDQSHNMFQQQPSSSYNYRVHGYNGHDHGYYHEMPHSTIVDETTSYAFSDDNTSACSIM